MLSRFFSHFCNVSNLSKIFVQRILPNSIMPSRPYSDSSKTVKSGGVDVQIMLNQCAKPTTSRRSAKEMPLILDNMGSLLKQTPVTTAKQTPTRPRAKAVKFCTPPGTPSGPTRRHTYFYHRRRSTKLRKTGSSGSLKSKETINSSGNLVKKTLKYCTPPPRMLGGNLRNSKFREYNPCSPRTGVISNPMPYFYKGGGYGVLPKRVPKYSGCQKYSGGPYKGPDTFTPEAKNVKPPSPSLTATAKGGSGETARSQGNHYRSSDYPAPKFKTPTTTRKLSIVNQTPSSVPAELRKAKKGLTESRSFTNGPKQSAGKGNEAAPADSISHASPKAPMKHPTLPKQVFQMVAVKVNNFTNVEKKPAKLLMNDTTATSKMTQSSCVLQTVSPVTDSQMEKQASVGDKENIANNFKDSEDQQDYQSLLQKIMESSSKLQEQYATAKIPRTHVQSRSQSLISLSKKSGCVLHAGSEYRRGELACKITQPTNKHINATKSSDNLPAQNSQKSASSTAAELKPDKLKKPIKSSSYAWWLGVSTSKVNKDSTTSTQKTNAPLENFFVTAKKNKSTSIDSDNAAPKDKLDFVLVNSEPLEKKGEYDTVDAKSVRNRGRLLNLQADITRTGIEQPIEVKPNPLQQTGAKAVEPEKELPINRMIKEESSQTNLSDNKTSKSTKTSDPTDSYLSRNDPRIDTAKDISFATASVIDLPHEKQSAHEMNAKTQTSESKLSDLPSEKKSDAALKSPPVSLKERKPNISPTESLRSAKSAAIQKNLEQTAFGALVQTSVDPSGGKSVIRVLNAPSDMAKNRQVGTPISNFNYHEHHKSNKSNVVNHTPSLNSLHLSTTSSSSHKAPSNRIDNIEMDVDPITMPREIQETSEDNLLDADADKKRVKNCTPPSEALASAVTANPSETGQSSSQSSIATTAADQTDPNSLIKKRVKHCKPQTTNPESTKEQSSFETKVLTFDTAIRPGKAKKLKTFKNERIDLFTVQRNKKSGLQAKTFTSKSTRPEDFCKHKTITFRGKPKLPGVYSANHPPAVQAADLIPIPKKQKTEVPAPVPASVPASLPASVPASPPTSDMASAPDKKALLVTDPVRQSFLGIERRPKLRRIRRQRVPKAVPRRLSDPLPTEAFNTHSIRSSPTSEPLNRQVIKTVAVPAESLPGQSFENEAKSTTKLRSAPQFHNSRLGESLEDAGSRRSEQIESDDDKDENAHSQQEKASKADESTDGETKLGFFRRLFKRVFYGPWK